MNKLTIVMATAGIAVSALVAGLSYSPPAQACPYGLCPTNPINVDNGAEGPNEGVECCRKRPQ